LKKYKTIDERRGELVFFLENKDVKLWCDQEVREVYKILEESGWDKNKITYLNWRRMK